MKRFVLPAIVLLLLLPSALAWSKGTQEKEFRDAQGKDNFSQSVDLTKLTPGQYNILVRTKDAAGNESFAGPFNFYYDPTSDNPLITVANPYPGMRLGSSLNVVGVSSAPKGTAKVEVQVDGADWVAAQGRAFWSYFLNTNGMTDGLHKIAVRGTDVNGIVGPAVTVPFHVDLSPPSFLLSTQNSGDRVSGTIALAGTVSDGNGLVEFDMSVDGRKTLQPISLQGDSKSSTKTFSTSLDTKKIPDGPLVLWFHAKDGQGSEVKRAILLYIDNTLPSLSVLSPAVNVGLHGRVRFVVQAEKTLGLRSLTARVGDKGEPITIPVVPGNPFHWVDLDLPSTGTGTLPIVFEAIDTSGKSGKITYVAKLNGGSDLPTVELASPLEKTQVRAPFRLIGSVVATDGPAGLGWSLNGSPEVIQPAGAAFDFLLPGLVTGNNKLVLVPIDTNAKRGLPVPITFQAIMGAPVVRVDSVVLSDQEVPFRPGMSVGPDKKAKFKGTLTWPNAPKSLTWTFGDGKETTFQTSGSGPNPTFLLPLPEDPPFGTVVVTVTAIDVFDQKTTWKSFVDVANLAKAQGPEGMAFADTRLGSNPLVITPEAPLKGYFSSGKIRSADLITAKGSVPVSVLQVTHDDQYVTIKGIKDGQFEGVKLRVVNDKGRIYDMDLGNLVGDTAPPAIALSSPLTGTWVRENLRIDGQVSDNNGLAKLEWSIDNGRSWQQLEPPAGQGGPFSRQFALPGPDNMVNLLVRATDNAGRTGTVLTVVRRDTQGPTLEFTFPTLEANATGTVYGVGRWKDDGALQKAEVSGGKKTSALPLDKPFIVALDAATLATTKLTFRATDWAGNVTEQVLAGPAPVATDPAAPSAAASPPAPVRTEIQVLYPRGDTKGLNGVIPVVGRVVGFSEIPSIIVKGEATGDKILETTDAGWFSFEVNVSAIKNRSLSFSAQGVAKEAAATSFNLPYDAASELPSARFLAQTEKPVLTGYVTASGWIGDSRGVVSWISQLDGGEKKTTVPDPTKPPVGTFLVDIGVPSVGNHKLVVIPVNALGREGAPAVTEFVSTTPSGPVEFTNIDLGIPMPVTKDSRIQGRIPSVNSWRKLEIRFADLALADAWNGAFQTLDARKGNDGVWTFDVPIPQNLPYSRIGVVVRGEDSLGQKVEGRTLFHRIWPKDASLIQDNEGLFFVDDRLNEATGRFDTVAGVPLLGTFRGRPIKSVSLSPSIPALTASIDGRQVSITASEEGLFGPFKLTAVTTDNESYTTPSLTIFADATGPLLDWEVPLNADWIRDTVTVTGKVSDPSGVASLDVSVDGGVLWQAMPTKNGVFDAKVTVPGPDGLTVVVLRAVDKGGHTSSDSRAIIKDNSAPAWTLVAPPADRKVNGLTTLVGTATDLNPIVSIEYSDNGKTFKPADGKSVFAFDLDFASYAKLPDKFLIRTTDAAGNQAVTPLVVPLDQEADKPVVQIQTPAEGEVVRGDFSVSGMAFDDDGVQSLSWRIDGGTWLRLEGTSSFQIPVPLSTLTDNEHVVEVQAQDIYGTKGEVFRSTFKVSLDPPSAVLFSPDIDKTVSGIVGLVGASFDRNTIQSVQVSLDNGLTWNRAELRKKEELIPTSTLEAVKGFLPTQRQEWEWRFDSKTLKDGTYLVMVKTTDGYATEGLFTALVNLDNTPPALTLTAPEDGTQILDTMTLEGRTSDNIKMITLKADLRPIEGFSTTGGKTSAIGNVVLTTELPVSPTFNYRWDLGNLVPGWYNLRMEARDAAGNSTYVARNIRIEGASADKVEILYPQAGETLYGSFVLEGKVSSRFKVESALVNLDGKTKVVVPVDEDGFFSILLDGSNLDRGDHTLNVTVQQTTTVTLTSEAKKVVFDPLGPWIRLTSHKSGAHVTQRPFFSGAAGWTETPLPDGSTPTETQAYQKKLENHQVVAVEVSLDNGKTFGPAQGTETWKYRLESLGLPDGPQPMVFRAKFRDGSFAIQRALVTIAQTAPTVKLLTQIENGRYNGSLELAGFTEGDGEVKAVEVAVRQGDKAGYEVPSFIQGMYLDSHFLGATVWEAGLGLTFFQEAVKLQAQIGQTPQFILGSGGVQNRFWGTVAGAKLIASILQLPAGYFFGPDWSWLSTSFGLGANFQNFSMNPNFGDFSSTKGVFLGGVVLQWETARVLLKDLTFLKSYSWYNEATVWFISSDVQAESIWTFSTGFRLGLF